jgi:hypothetical protein
MQFGIENLNKLNKYKIFQLSDKQKSNKHVLIVILSHVR